MGGFVDEAKKRGFFAQNGGIGFYVETDVNGYKVQPFFIEIGHTVWRKWSPVELAIGGDRFSASGYFLVESEQVPKKLPWL